MIARLRVVAILEMSQGDRQGCDSQGVVLVGPGGNVYSILLELLEDILDVLLAVLRLGDEVFSQLLEILDHDVEVGLE